MAYINGKVVSSSPDIFPVEVKAGRIEILHSLHQFVATGKSSITVRFDINTASRKPVTHQLPFTGGMRTVSFELLSLRLYAVGELER